MRIALSAQAVAAARLLLTGLILALALAATGLNPVLPTAAQTTLQGETVTFAYTGDRRPGRCRPASRRPRSRSPVPAAATPVE